MYHLPSHHKGTKLEVSILTEGIYSGDSITNYLLEHFLKFSVIHVYEPLKKHTLTAKDYQNWVNDNVAYDNYIFLWRLCFAFLLTFHLYNNKSVRKNSHARMMTARAASVPIFFGRNHPRYREVHVKDM